MSRNLYVLSNIADRNLNLDRFLTPTRRSYDSWSLSDCEQNNWRSYEQILMEISEVVDNGPGSRWFHFRDVPESGGTLTFDLQKIKASNFFCSQIRLVESTLAGDHQTINLRVRTRWHIRAILWWLLQINSMHGSPFFINVQRIFKTTIAVTLTSRVYID